MTLTSQQYGKARVRVLKVTRSGERHEITEVDVCVMLEGDFGGSYTNADNRQVVATDTMKNTVHVLAKEVLGAELERFGLDLCAHFLKRYPQVRQADIRIEERPWRRLMVAGTPHHHTFTGNSQERPFAQVIATREQTTVASGVSEYLILKSTGSGFEGFYPDHEYTTLKPTADRILATSLDATWRYAQIPLDYRAANQRILDAMLNVFATNYSPSVQATLYQMAEAALRTVPEISQVDLKLPNKHYIPIDLSPFKRENKKEIFLPTDEPHGQIEATVSRDAR